MTEPVFRRLLIPTDGSEASVGAARLAFRICRGHGGDLTLLFVVDEAVVRELTRFGRRRAAEVELELREHGQRYLELLCTEAEQRGLPLRTLIRQGNPFEEIVAVADELGVQLIIMGHVGQRGTARVLMGSVTQRVLDFASCPVLVVKS